MGSLFSKALSEKLSNHTGLSQTRRETLGWLVFLVMQYGTVCLWRLAAHVAGDATTASVRRRFYRFFQYIKLDGAVAARMVVELLGLEGKPWVLAIDRTNWEFGKTSINILMISVMWKDTGIPLIWTLLPSAGNSDTTTRTGLLDRLREIFPGLNIARLTGDREFIGAAWMAYLADHNIPFILRLRENQHVIRPGYDTWTISRIAGRLKPGDKHIVKGWCRLGQNPHDQSPPVRLAIMRLPTRELLILACAANPRRALQHYRHRWKIETLFANLKTRGFNIEDTHITNPDKLSTLLAIMAMAVALAVKTGVAAAGITPIPHKHHGRKQCSLFALGLNNLRKMFATAKPQPIITFLKQLLSPKIHLKHKQNCHS